MIAAFFLAAYAAVNGPRNDQPKCQNFLAAYAAVNYVRARQRKGLIFLAAYAAVNGTVAPIGG